MPLRLHKEERQPGGKPPVLGWAEASIWTERMKSALGNGVKGGKWFSLMDKVYRPSTLEVAWLKAKRTRGRRDRRPKSRAVRDGREALSDRTSRKSEVRPLQPLAGQARRYPQGKGQTRPLGIPS